jgi:hypothetical protein
MENQVTGNEREKKRDQIGRKPSRAKHLKESLNTEEYNIKRDLKGTCSRI